MRVDLLYLAKNRLEFTKESFSALLSNTDWNLVKSFYVYDDGSTDGTAEYLTDTIIANREILPDKTVLRQTDFGSPVRITNDFVVQVDSPLLAKIDNDIVVPEKWLTRCVQVMDGSPELQCLGIEAFYEIEPDVTVCRGWIRAIHTGGIGLFRRAPFEEVLPIAYGTYFGFGNWQQRGDGLMCGWIKPSLPVFLLDRLPFEPFRSLTLSYIEKGWQRDWGPYDSSQQDLWTWRFPNERG